MLRTVRNLAASAALLVLPLAACGGGDSASGGCGSASTTNPSITVHAQDSLKFDKTEYSAKAGDVTMQYVNDGTLVHTLLIKEKSGCKLSVTGRGDTKTGSVNLTAGTYTL